MAIRIVRLGSPRAPNEGVRIGTVRRPPRGVPKADFARRDFYDVWLPELAPSEALIKAALATETDADWQRFRRRFRSRCSHSASCACRARMPLTFQVAIRTARKLRREDAATRLVRWSSGSRHTRRT